MEVEGRPPGRGGLVPKWLQFLIAIGSPLFAAGGAYTAVSVKLDWMRADIARLESRVDRLEYGEARRAEVTAKVESR